MEFSLDYNEFKSLHTEYSRVSRISKNESFVKNSFLLVYKSIQLRYELFKINLVYRKLSKTLKNSWNKIEKLPQEDLVKFHDLIIKTISKMDEIDAMYKDNSIKTYRSSHESFKEILFETSSKLRKQKNKMR